MNKKNLTAAKLWIVLARSHHSLTLLVEQSIANAGLCLSDFMVIEALLHKGPLTITEIQQKVLLAVGSMTVAVDRLEKKGLIVRKTTAADRRARVLQLTPEGKKIAVNVFKAHSADMEKVMSILNNTEMQHTYAALKRLGHHAAETLDNQKLEAMSKGR
jgi:MarR family 2-MHQ and catechol resistance regulon transcriptional repressor